MKRLRKKLDLSRETLRWIGSALDSHATVFTIDTEEYPCTAMTSDESCPPNCIQHSGTPGTPEAYTRDWVPRL